MKGNKSHVSTYQIFLTSGHFIEPEEVYNCAIQNDKFVAKKLCTSVSNYNKAKELYLNHSQYHFRCCAITSKKVRCKNSILDKDSYNEFEIIEDLSYKVDTSGVLCELHRSNLMKGKDFKILPIMFYEASNYD